MTIHVTLFNTLMVSARSASLLSSLVTCRNDDRSVCFRRAQIGPVLLIMALLVGVFSTGGAADDATSRPTKGMPDWDAISNQIELLANRNKRPEMVMVRTKLSPVNPFFGEDYDWKEEYRAIQAAEGLTKYNRETLWQCTMEHLDDERYAFSYGFNGLARVASIGDLCWEKASYDLEFPYWRYSPGIDVGSPVRQLRSFASKENLKEWWSGHKEIPLYKQQIELCKKALLRIHTVKPVRKITEQEMSSFIANLNATVDELERTEKPIFGSRDLLWKDTEFYNADIAKAITAEYLRTKNTDAKRGERKQ